MPRRTFTHGGGRHMYLCKECKLYMFTEKDIIRCKRSDEHTTYVVAKVPNTKPIDHVAKRVTNGVLYMLRRVICKRCKENIGFLYEFADNNTPFQGAISIDKTYITEEYVYNKKLAEESPKSSTEPFDRSDQPTVVVPRIHTGVYNNIINRTIRKKDRLYSKTDFDKKLV